MTRQRLRLTFGYIVTFLCVFITKINAEEVFFCDPCQPSFCCDFDFEFKASYLYWKLQQDHVGFCVTKDHHHHHHDDHDHHHHHHQLLNKFASSPSGWESGVRLEFDAISQCCPYGGRLSWSHFAMNSSQSEKKQCGLGGYGHFDFSLDTYIFDLEAFFGCEPCVFFRSYLGVMVADLNQKQRVTFEDFPFEHSLGNLKVTGHNNYLAVGPRVGLEFDVNIWRKLNIITNSNFAYLFGTNSCCDKSCSFRKSRDKDDDSDCKHCKHSKSCRRESPMASILVGLEWESQFTDTVSFACSLGYEFQYWWVCHNSKKRLCNDLVVHEKWCNFSLQGLVLSGSISY